MKKTALFVALSALAVASSANAGWYAQGDLGFSKVKFSEYSALDSSKMDPRFSLGYSFGNYRLAADYNHHGNYSGNDKGHSISAKIYGLGFSAIYDFSVSSPLTPYAGIRLAQNVFKVSNSRPGYFSDNTENKFGYGVVGGVRYQLAPNWLLNGGLEYNRLGKFDDTKVNHFDAKVGIRFNF